MDDYNDHNNFTIRPLMIFSIKVNLAQSVCALHHHVIHTVSTDCAWGQFYTVVNLVVQQICDSRAARF